MKRRYVLKNKRRFMTIIMLIIISSIFTGLIVSAGAASEVNNNEQDYERIKVKKGDTLWEIAMRHNQNRDLRSYIYKIKKLNNLDNNYIYAGQELLLP